MLIYHFMYFIHSKKDSNFFGLKEKFIKRNDIWKKFLFKSVY